MNTLAQRSLLSRSLRSWLSRDATLEGPRWLLWVWTLLLCGLIAFGFTALGMAVNASGGGRAWAEPGLWLKFIGVNLKVALPIGVLIHVMFDVLIGWLGAERIRRFSDGRRAAFYSAVPLIGVAIGWPLGVWWAGEEFGGPRTASGIAGAFAIGLVVSLVIYLIFSAKAQQIEAEKRAVEAQLRLLHAQMEPHFLFNTLAGVLTLIEAEPPRARRMLEAFTDYLRASVGRIRADESTLAAELDLAGAYLQLLQLRMEDRLVYDIDVDAEARRAAMPPLMLQPLVENAIQHGLEPKLDGGRLRIRARVADGRLQLEVQDDGLGSSAPPRSGGNGIALENIRQRLQAVYGGAASLTVDQTAPGTRATLQLPFTAAAPAR